jgi:type IX secretion system PorP/SprF family membrane protein
MRKMIIILFMLFSAGKAWSQDPHFSQYFSSPLTMNPALTGNFEGLQRFAANYRKQWWQVGSPYNTGTISFEQKLLQKKIEDESRFAIGGMFLTDESLAGGFRSTTGSLSAGYHQALDRLGVHSIGTGLMGTFSNRIVDFNRLSFGSQFTSGGFDPSLPSGEYFPMGLKPYFDVNAGLVYSYNDGENSMYIGSSVYHAGKPRFSLFQDSVSRIPRRYTLHAGANFYLGKNTYHRMILTGIYMSQAKATEFTLGMAYGHYIGDNYNTKYFYFGSFYRKGDAVYPYASLQLNNMQFGISYDINISKLKNIAPRYGSLEFTFIYTKPDDKESRRLMPWNY